MLKAGDTVMHITFGKGRIVEIVPREKAVINFTLAGQKLMSLTQCSLTKLSEDEARDALLDSPGAAKSFAAHTAKLGERRHKVNLLNAIEAFLQEFPLGTSDPRYLEQEREYKIEARDKFDELLHPQKFSALLNENQIDEITRRVEKLCDTQNKVLQWQDVDTLKKGLEASDLSRREFARKLFDLLFRSENQEEYFDDFAHFLMDMGIQSWRMTTYFPSIAFPYRHALLKTTGAQRAAVLCRHNINYRPQPNWQTYNNYLHMVMAVRDALLSSNNPLVQTKDLIDVQSFLWVCCSPHYKIYDKLMA